MTDKELIKKLKKDKSSGLSVVIDMYSGLLYKIAANVILPVGSREDVEECVSDSFLAFYREIDAIDLEKASIKAYLAVITKRKAIDFYRKLKRASEMIPASPDSALDIASDDFTVSHDRKALLLEALRNLGEPDTTIITRKFYLGETAREIAEALGMSEQAVQKRIERSRQRLQTELGGVLNG